MSKLRKTFTISVMMMTVLAMSVVVAPEASATASAGDLIKMEGLSSIYYLAADGKRYVFPNEQTYFSWYSDFSSVVTIPQSELESYPLGKNVTIRPGTKLVKITTDPKVYAVEPGGDLVWVPDETTASTLYGANWAQRVVDVSDSFFTNYNVIDEEVSATAYPEGSLVKFGDSADVYYITTDNTARKITTEAAFTVNRFKWDDVITATIDMPDTGADISGAVADLIDTSSGAGGVAGAGSGLTVALSANTPAADTIIGNSTGNAQALVPLLKMDFTASSDGNVKVTNLKIKRNGISADTDLDSLYLYEGDDLLNPLVDGATVSSNYVTFNNAAGLFTVSAGTTKVITLRADLAYDVGAGKTMYFTLESASDVTTDGAEVSGSFPVSGNTMSTANATDLGRLALTAGTTPASDNVSVNADQTGYEVWKVTLTSTGQNLELHNIKFTEVGSVMQGDLANFKLYYGGTLLAEEDSMNSNYEVDFDLSDDPFEIPKGAQRILSLRADIVKGSTREFYFSIQDQNDVVVKDSGYGVLIQPYTVNTWSIIKPNGDWYIAAGSLSVSKSSDSPTEDIVVDGLDVVFAKYDFRASGEDIKVKNLLVEAITTGRNGVDNVKVYQDGVQVGSTADIDAGASATTTFSFGSTFVVPAGETSVVEIKGDAKKADSTSYSNTNTIQVGLYTGLSNAQRLSSLGTFAAPSAVTQGDSRTITSAALTITEYSGLGDATVVAGANNVKLGSFVLTAGAAEGADVSSITVALDSSPDEAGSITNMYLKDHATGEQLGETVVSPSTSNIISVSFSLAASGTKTIDLYANTVSGSNPGDWTANIDADGSGSTTGNTISVDATDIQTMTFGRGALYPANGSHPSSAIILAGTTDNSIAQFSFTSSNEGFTISKLILKTENNFASATPTVTISYTDEDGDNQEETKPFVSSSSMGYSTATFVGLGIYIPKDASRNIDVTVDSLISDTLKSETSGNSGKIYLEYAEGFKATGDAGTSVTDLTGRSSDLSGNIMYIRKSKPTFSKIALTGTPTSGSALFKFKVVSDSTGEIELKQLGFTFTTTAATVSSIQLFESGVATALTDTVVEADSDGHARLIIGRAATTGSIGGGTASDDDIIRVGTSGKTLEVQGTVGGFGAAGDSITVQFRKDSAATLTAAVGTLIQHNGQNIWSDLSITGEAHTTATKDWTNGYLLGDMNISQDWSK